MSDALKLMALDAEDLTVLSAHVQDSVLKSSDIDYSPSRRVLILSLNRFAWEAPSARRLLFKKYQRRRSVLHFAGVERMGSIGINRNAGDEVYALLAVSFEEDSNPDNPGGTIELRFGGGAAIRLEVECLEVQLTDLGSAWEASGKPKHGV